MSGTTLGFGKTFVNKIHYFSFTLVRETDNKQIKKNLMPVLLITGSDKYCGESNEG